MHLEPVAINRMDDRLNLKNNSLASICHFLSAPVDLETDCGSRLVAVADERMFDIHRYPE